MVRFLRGLILLEIMVWIVAGVLFVVSGIHMYWALGGSAGHRAAIPTSGGAPLFRPSKLATIIVALLLALAGWFVLEWGGGYRWMFPDFSLSFGGWLLAVVFMMRAVGDFKWLGFFKKKKGTLFARWDSLLYSPLCFMLGIALVLIGLLRVE
jgi:hypothetical protein